MHVGSDKFLAAPANCARPRRRTIDVAREEHAGAERVRMPAVPACPHAGARRDAGLWTIARLEIAREDFTIWTRFGVAAVRGHEGLEQASANLMGQVHLAWDDERTSREAILASLAKAGFRPLEPVP